MQQMQLCKGENIEIIDKSDFIDVYVFKTLNEIKNVVRREIVLEKTREE